MSPVLPFAKTGQVQQQGGTVAGTVDLSYWPAGEPRETRVGEAYDYLGEADAAGAGLLVGKANRSIVVDGLRFKVVSAIAHDYLPHVELRLRQMGV